ncbi:hypothetical protein D8674_037412 [Pyrus ussuriensis x Pyrus communis]|uniref:Uncharacterized protein n=1 Tax=Pyrus ussuriensis x Pyrus communis TaxID=2448454 RepID=A0A5N5GW61_9ROSA|nr:hypothetical protein D8674_037412 [Pyrus ussuriensis x Pyrus communis]
MAEASRSSSGNRRQPSRLQRRAPPPSSLQINRVTDWNVAIPLLSPLVSPDQPIEAKSRDDARQHQRQQKELPRHHQQGAEADKSAQVAVFKKWQHPAAPFCNDTAQMVPPFVQFR